MAERGQSGGFRLTLVGCNHESAATALRGRIAFTPEQALHAANELCLRGAVAEAVVLSTCNRSEVYGVSNGATEDAGETLENFLEEFHGLLRHEMDGHLYRRLGLDAAQHLFRVASGLDSLLLGEAEILGQVRDAYTKALEHGTTGPVLNRLFQSALEIGKRVRTETELGTRPMSVAFAGVKLAESVFGDLEGHKALVVGAGAVAEHVVEHLRKRGISEMRIVNRSLEHARELADRFEAQVEEWLALNELLVWPDVIVTSVGGGVSIINRALLESAMAARDGRAIFIVDLAMPRNVEPDAAQVYNVYLYNLDDLGEIVNSNRRAREAEVPHAESLIEEQITKFEAWRNRVEAATLIEDLRGQMHTAGASYLRDHHKALAHLPEQERQTLERLMDGFIERILKAPAERLRASADLRKRIERVEVLRDLFGFDEEKD